MDLGPHAAFIWMAYGATALVLTGLVARAILDERRQKKALVKLEAQGARRRSTGAASGFDRP
jgi:heme exporter protein D